MKISSSGVIQALRVDLEAFINSRNCYKQSIAYNTTDQQLDATRVRKKEPPLLAEEIEFH